MSGKVVTQQGDKNSVNVTLTILELRRPPGRLSRRESVCQPVGPCFTGRPGGVRPGFHLLRVEV